MQAVIVSTWWRLATSGTHAAETLMTLNLAVLLKSSVSFRTATRSHRKTFQKPLKNISIFHSSTFHLTIASSTLAHGNRPSLSNFFKSLLFCRIAELACWTSLTSKIFVNGRMFKQSGRDFLTLISLLNRNLQNFPLQNLTEKARKPIKF